MSAVLTSRLIRKNRTCHTDMSGQIAPRTGKGDKIQTDSAYTLAPTSTTAGSTEYK